MLLHFLFPSFLHSGSHGKPIPVVFMWKLVAFKRQAKSQFPVHIQPTCIVYWYVRGSHRTCHFCKVSIFSWFTPYVVCVISPDPCIFGKLDDVWNFKKKRCASNSRKKVEPKREIVNVSPGLTDPSHKRLCTDGERAAERPYIHLISPSVCLTQSALTAGIPPPFICISPLIPLLFIYLAAILQWPAVSSEAALVNKPEWMNTVTMHSE